MRLCKGCWRVFYCSPLCQRRYVGFVYEAITLNLRPTTATGTKVVMQNAAVTGAIYLEKRFELLDAVRYCVLTSNSVCRVQYAC